MVEIDLYELPLCHSAKGQELIPRDGTNEGIGLYHQDF